MLEIWEDREQVRLHREIKRSKKSGAIKFDCNVKALMMLEGMSLQVTLGVNPKDAFFCYNDPR